MGRTMLARLALAGGIVTLAPALAFAQNLPTKPITLILPYAAGGNTDAIARTIAHNLEQRLGQSVEVETRLGAASVIGATYVARAAPDGYTILIGTSTTMAINVSIYKNLPYDPTKDLVPLALIAGIPAFICWSIRICSAFGAGPDRCGQVEAGRPVLRVERPWRRRAFVRRAVEVNARHRDDPCALQGADARID